MTRILFIGQAPETVDFSDPAIPAAFKVEKIHAGSAKVDAFLKSVPNLRIEKPFKRATLRGTIQQVLIGATGRSLPGGDELAP